MFSKPNIFPWLVRGSMGSISFGLVLFKKFYRFKNIFIISYYLIFKDKILTVLQTQNATQILLFNLDNPQRNVSKQCSLTSFLFLYNVQYTWAHQAY
jgi:hypothetical protein